MYDVAFYAMLLVFVMWVGAINMNVTARRAERANAARTVVASRIGTVMRQAVRDSVQSTAWRPSDAPDVRKKRSQ